MTRQAYKKRYLCIFKMTDKTGSSNMSSFIAHSHSHRLIQPNESAVSITVILARKTKFSTTPDLKKVSTNKCDIEHITGKTNVAIRTGSTYVLRQHDRYHYNSDFKPGVSTRARWQKASTSNCNIKRQPEVAILPSKTEIVTGWSKKAEPLF